MSRQVRVRRLLAALLMLVGGGASVGAMPFANDTVAKPADLPLHEVPAQQPGPWIAVFITGDGGWVDADRALANALAARGVSVIALDARAYLRGGKRSPSAAAKDAERILRYYETLWHRDQVMLVGYSRGADMMPFIANRIAEDLRGQVGLVALLGLSRRASFEFHWSDLIRDARRPTDLPVAPELERLRGVRMLCVYGVDDHGSACRDVEPGLATVVERSGAHRLDADDATDLARTIVGAISQ
ncbi:MAG: AcvB/VirJ family lysyl-phosphatidylglycerol hydrolase [Gemmatimonadaceae bacterium]